jgi:hypothetical protein
MWSSDGKRLFYVRPPATGNRASIIYSVDVLRSDTSFDFGKEQRLLWLSLAPARTELSAHQN